VAIFNFFNIMIRDAPENCSAKASPLSNLTPSRLHYAYDFKKENPPAAKNATGGYYI
jgi:hypothetical protein